MPKKALGSLTEQMLYILMAFRDGPKCGTEISNLIKEKTGKRISIGPSTLYTLLAKFEEADYIIEIDKEQPGRKRTYALTKKGLNAYAEEVRRLQACLKDARSTEEALAQRAKTEKNAHSSNDLKMEEKYRNPGSH
ncbi:MAG: PadR family transcriptional regulator [Erysipelotrichaceae bacterium]|nr:PadR family transcriptional regulator [Erysipelotrichaceae bacterium]